MRFASRGGTSASWSPRKAMRVKAGRKSDAWKNDARKADARKSDARKSDATECAERNHTECYQRQLTGYRGASAFSFIGTELQHTRIGVPSVSSKSNETNRLALVQFGFAAAGLRAKTPARGSYSVEFRGLRGLRGQKTHCPLHVSAGAISHAKRRPTRQYSVELQLFPCVPWPRCSVVPRWCATLLCHDNNPLITSSTANAPRLAPVASVARASAQRGRTANHSRR